MAGYTRNDTTDQIANGNTIDAVPLDGEFNAIQGAFASTGGHKHDGSTGEGAPITVIGPAQDVVASSNSLSPKADDAQDLGTSSLEWRNLWIDGTANIDSLVADTADINAGTIDGTIIGGSVAAAVTATTLAATSATVGGVNVTTNTATQTLTNKTVNLADNTLIATSAQVAAAVTDETGSGALVFGTSPTLSSPTITGGTITGITDLTVADGGTGASTAADARTNLGAQATITGAATSVTSANLTASRALVSDASGKIAASSVTATELGNLSGSSSNLQTQINSIVAGQLNITGAASTIDTEDLTINRAVVSDAAGKIAVSAATSAQVGYLSNVTSDIQTQINNKQNFDAGLQSIAGLSTSANQMLYTTAADTYATTGLTAAGRTLIAAADDVAQRTALGLGSLATQTGTFSGTSSGTNTGDQNIFRNVAVAGQSTIVADTTTDTLTFASGSGITITTDATTDTVTFSATGSGGTVSSVDVSGGTTGLTTSGGPITGSGTITLAGTLTVANGGTGATSAINARTNLGLGTLSTQAASAVTITGGTISGITDLAVLDGGTGASDALTARANLGVAIGSNVQAWDANLDQIAALIPTADNFIVGNGTAWVQETPAQVLTSLGITSTAAELNKLDGVTAVAADLNILAGQAALGLIGTELGYVNGVTSNIQTQLDEKAPLASPTLTGTPTAPTAAVGTTTTQIATTAFVSAGVGVANSSLVKTALNASGSAPIYACRGWVNFNGTGTVAIRASGNVSSITDNATGNYTVNFTTAMPDANYATSAASVLNQTAYQVLSSSAVQIFTQNSSGVPVDPSDVSVVIFR